MRLRGMLVAVVVLALGAGCGSRAHASDGGSLPSDPSAALVAAAGRSAGQPVHLTMVMGGKTLQTGVVDRPEYFEVTGDSYVLRRIGPDIYFKVHGSVLDVLGDASVYQRNVGDKWVHMSVPVDAEHTLTLRHDYPFTAAYNASHGTALTSDGHTIAGMLPGSGDDAQGSATPGKFTAEIDPAGHITSLLAGIGDSSIEFRFSGYGASAHLAAPQASQVVEDDGLYYPALLVNPELSSLGTGP